MKLFNPTFTLVPTLFFFVHIQGCKFTGLTHRERDWIILYINNFILNSILNENTDLSNIILVHFIWVKMDNV